MRNTIKIFVINHDNKPIHKFAQWINGAKLITKDKAKHKADLFLFIGGPDISPALYADKQHPFTITDIARDKKEYEYYKYARKHKIPMVGICRGAQLLCALSGGFIIQHINNHVTAAHSVFCKAIKNDAVRESWTNSTHHQMMYPYNLKRNNYELYAWTKQLSTIYEGGTGEMKSAFHDHAFYTEEVEPTLLKKVLREAKIDTSLDKVYAKKVREPEIIHFKNTNCLAIQSHPERLEHTSFFRGYCNDLINELLLKK